MDTDKNKKEHPFIKAINFIRDVIIIIGFPILFVFMLRIHSMTNELHDAEKDMLKTNIDVLKEQQVDRLSTKYKNMKEFYESEIKEKDSSFFLSKEIIDSLKEYIRESVPNKKFTFTENQIKAIGILIIKNEYNDSIIVSYEKASKNVKELVTSLGSEISALKEIIRLKDEQLKIFENNK